MTSTKFKPGSRVIMRNRLRDEVVTVLTVTGDDVLVNGTTARFCRVTGKQKSYANCWDGWRIEPLEVEQ
jgi:hypothetical protein